MHPAHPRLCGDLFGNRRRGDAGSRRASDDVRRRSQGHDRSIFAAGPVSGNGSGGGAGRSRWRRGSPNGVGRLQDSDSAYPDLAEEHAFLLTYARVLCATALCDDDLHVRSLPLWEQVLAAVTAQSNASTEPADFLRVNAAIAYGRFCVETGRLPEAQPWLRRAAARAQANGWELATARTQLERAAAAWSARDQVTTEHLVSEAYPVIARHARAHDVSRCWLYLGLTRMASGTPGSRRRVLAARRAALA